ncbi:MAG: hypothetical protein R3F35_11460 [Myxococcota bacterium]
MAARVGCIAWGSLLWDPRTLPLAAPFRHAGPPLPIEFSRVALDGRVTLVIDPEAAPVRTWWAPLAVASIDSAVAELARREGVAAARVADWIGLATRVDATATAAAGSGVAIASRSLGSTAGPSRSGIERWLAEQSLDAVVWTALPARRPDGRFERPACAELIEHLERLEGVGRERAERYVRRAPAPLRTPNRIAFEARFGWSCDVDAGRS